MHYSVRALVARRCSPVTLISAGKWAKRVIWSVNSPIVPGVHSGQFARCKLTSGFGAKIECAPNGV